jgi:hemerythrin-like domain-containing protein
MTRTATAQKPDTHVMVVVHRVFRREVRLLPRLVEATSAEDRPQVDRVVAHAREVLDTLHHHHTGEDELLWPRLRERAELDDDLVDRMQRQHEQVGGLLAEVGRLLPIWQQDPSGPHRAELVDDLSRLSVALEAHLEEEEERILPLAEQHITVPEWNELGERGMASLPKDRVLVLLGYIFEETDPSERVEFLSNVPLPGRIAYRLIGQRKYQKEVSALRRGIIPEQGRR